MSPTQTEQYNTIDRIYTEAQLAAEQKCQKFHAGKIPWMSLLTQAIYRVLYWKGIQKQLAGGQIATTILQQRAQQGQLEHQAQHLILTQVKATTQIKEAAKDCLQIKKQVD